MTKLTNTQIYEKLSAPFPIEAYSVDSSRGFDLSSLKAQYIVERFNEVLGIGFWKLEGEFKEAGKDILYFGTLSVFINGDWSGHSGVGHSLGKRNLGDTYKSAQTDAMSKLGSKFGVGNDSFKGLVDPRQIKSKTPFKGPQKPVEARKPTSMDQTIGKLRKLCSDMTDNFCDLDKCDATMQKLGIKKWSDLSGWDEGRMRAAIAALS